ncbi:MAG: hypothetical protein PHY34_04800 [Patescibacteria group bacterium]|nr:hypothetical protein [Patescibacteria group bacterium]MDD5715612.1 hypothetical protein [Patescibacteria group bacterium]
MANGRIGKVYVVDDHPAYRDEIIQLLRRGGTKLSIIASEYGMNGRGILFLLRQQPPLIQMVVIMQKVRGNARLVAEAVRADSALNGRVRIIFIDCTTRSPEDISAGRIPVRVNGADDILSNLTPGELKKILCTRVTVSVEPVVA